MGDDDSDVGEPRTDCIQEKHTHPEPPGHFEDHLRVMVRRELLLSEGKRRRGGGTD